jgi:hypothetical protein
MELTTEELKKFIDSYGKPLNSDLANNGKGFKPLPIVEQDYSEDHRVTPISDWCKHYALIFDDTGHEISKVRVKYSKPHFKFKTFSYNFKPNDTSFFKIKGFWGNKKYYFYNINNPDGLLLKSSGVIPIIDSEVYTSILENTHIKDLNALADGGFWAFIKKYWWLILIILIGAGVWYYFSGQNAQQTAQVISSTVTTLPKNTTIMTR